MQIFYVCSVILKKFVPILPGMLDAIGIWRLDIGIWNLANEITTPLRGNPKHEILNPKQKKGRI
jgi:hypothetical protein